MPITIEQHYSKKPDCPLYHYTSPASCIGIIKNREFWATQIQYMNDAKEMQQAIDIARKIIRNEYSTKGSPDLHRLLDTQLGAEDGANTFVVSLSEQNDQLSQWRAYCPEGGVCLGFDPDKMLGLLVHNQGFKLVRCVYDEGTQHSLIREIVQKCFDEYDNLPSHDFNDVQNFVRRGFREDLKVLASSIKNHSFAEEREWRLIGGPFKFKDPTLDWRAGRDTIIPYYKFVLGDVPPLISACTGPARDPKYAHKAMISLLWGQPWYTERGQLELSETRTPFRVL